MHKQLLRNNLRNIAIFIVALSIFVLSVDPYNLYRDKKIAQGMQQRMLNAGLIKTYKYDTVVLGSSMTENFSMSEIASKLNCQPVKLSLSGATEYEIKFLLEKAVDTGKVKRALICLDLTAFDKELREQRGTLPEYLYDNNYWNDYSYIFNFQTIGDSFKAVKNIYRHKYDTQDSLYSWAQEYTFSEADVLKRYQWRLKASDNGAIDAQLLEKMQANYRANLASVLRENPQIQFDLFFPPYSVLMYDLWARQQKLATYLAFKVWLQQELIGDYQNKTIYDFQADKTLITNLDNYKDYSHYKPEINSNMVTAMASKQQVVATQQQVQDNLQSLKMILREYNYQELFDKYK